ncbi:MAG: dodecin domain-containing protein [Gemmatimonadota bacterium]|nr:dodecin domain-containing protein [Gemmatimonadota bacterium]
MAEPFLSEPATKPGLLFRRPGSRARTTAACDLERLLAASPRVTDVTSADVVAAAARHELDVARHLRGSCRDLYRRYLAHCFMDRRLSDDEAEDLAHLRRVLRLGEDDCAAVHREVAVGLFGTAVEEAFEDLRLEPEEKAFLERLRTDLHLEEEAAGEALARAARRARTRFLATSSAGEGALVAPHEAAVELRGSSVESIEGAVRDAIARAGDLLPDIERVEIVATEARIAAGEVDGWDVTLRAILPRPH